MSKSIIGLTVGDPAGVGPEIVDAALTSRQLDPAFEYEVIGTPGEGFTPGKPSDDSARAAWDALEEAVRRLREQEIRAVVTGPVSKENLYKIGYTWPGITEFLAERFSVGNDYAMLLTGGRLSVALVTIHEPIAKIPRLLTTHEIVRIGTLLADFLALRLGHEPRVAVAALNPHAGEGGKMGDEEGRVIAPAVEQLQRRFARRAEFSGPHPPDTIFHDALEGLYDGVLCMYHDQGLIPLKLHAFHEGVNTTLGLPVIRCSPDHGTAFRIAGSNTANPGSYISACKLAAELVHRRGGT